MVTLSPANLLFATFVCYKIHDAYGTFRFWSSLLDTIVKKSLLFRLDTILLRYIERS